METDPDELIPMSRVAAAMLLGSLAVFIVYAVLIAFWSSSTGMDGTLRLVGTLALFAFGAMVFPGLPIAAVLLRDADASVLRWMIVGAATGLLASLICGFWIWGASFPIMFVTFIGPMLAALIGAATLFGLLAGLAARLILPSLLKR